MKSDEMEEGSLTIECLRTQSWGEWLDLRRNNLWEDGESDGDLRNFHSSLDTILVTKSKRIYFAGHVASLWKYEMHMKPF
jgi:hypothetical protein